jgi:nucleoside-diphosphate-sugar epimerase
MFWSQRHAGAVNVQADLLDPAVCEVMVRGVDQVYHLAAMIGGIGYLESRHADCTRSVAITSSLLAAAVQEKVTRFLFPSSACVYPDTGRPDAPPLKEVDDQPYAPRGGYGWQKLFSEQMCRFYRLQYGLEVRLPRLGTVYGPRSPIGEHEKAPIAICRKVVEAVRAGRDVIEIWGDGRQTRSFLYVDDAIDALRAVMDCDYPEPLNIGSRERVSVDALVSVVEHVAGVRLARRYELDKPQGVRGRVCDVRLAAEVAGWRERTPLRAGIEKTYRWVEAVHGR